MTMNTTSIVLLSIAVLVVGILIAGAASFARMAKGSQNRDAVQVGEVHGQFSACPDTPNCVNSQAEMTDAVSYVQPYRYDVPFSDARQVLVQVLHSLPRVTIVKALDRYIWAEVRSGVFGFVDDIEFYFPEDHHIVHVRSASRVGSADLGANRNRVERLRKLFQDRVTVL